ncbi:MAG: hypothetical protein NZ703_13670, partial [Gemmataceae bacterium]|nr:hypothetical protein [Gemmataceae bacterium]
RITQRSIHSRCAARSGPADNAHRMTTLWRRAAGTQLLNRLCGQVAVFTTAFVPVRTVSLTACGTVRTPGPPGR